MAHAVCPWCLGYFLACPIRRWFQDPHTLLTPWIRPGMTVLEPGPGMGFFTLELARLVGSEGKVVAVDIQPRMLKSLAGRARRSGLSDRIELREAKRDCLGIEDLYAQVDFVLAFALVHELPDSSGFFREVKAALKQDGRFLLSEPNGHVSEQAFLHTISLAEAAGLKAFSPITIRWSHSVLMTP